MAAHAKWSPSSMKRLLKCPYSATLAMRVGGGSNGSIYAAEGTLMHEVGEKLLLGQIDSPPEFGSVHTIDGHQVEWTRDMQAAVEVYVDYVRGLVRPGSQLHVEVRVVIDEDVWGTSDIIIWHPDTRHMDVADLKGGKGVVVDADSDQLLVYAVAAMNTMGVEPLTVTTHIVQPRAIGEGGGIRTSKFTTIDLWHWRDTVLNPGIERLQNGDTTIEAGDHCRFCPAKGVCPEMQRKALAVAKMEFGEAPPEVTTMSDDELATALDQAELINEWVKGVRAEASRRLDVGGSIPRWKLVPKRATRKWINEKEALERLAELGLESWQFTETSILSVAQLAKALPEAYAQIEGDLVSKTSSGSTLVREGDPRKALVLGPKADFSEFPSEDA